MAEPIYFTNGTSDTDFCTVNLTPAYPSVVNAGEVAILAVVSRQSVLDSYTITDPNGSWTLVTSYDGSIAGSAPRVFIYKRVCNGSEDNDTITVHSNVGGATIRHTAQIWTFQGSDGSTENAHVNVFTTGTTINDDDVTTSGDDRLVVNIVCNNGSDASFGDFSGSLWSNDDNIGGNTPSIYLYTGSAPTAGTYGGESISIGAARNVRVAGFALFTLPPPIDITSSNSIDNFSLDADISVYTDIESYNEIENFELDGSIGSVLGIYSDNYLGDFSLDGNIDAEVVNFISSNNIISNFTYDFDIMTWTEVAEEETNWTDVSERLGHWTDQT